MMTSDILPLSAMPASQLARILDEMPVVDRQPLIDEIFLSAKSASGDERERLYSLAWRCNDIAVLLNRGADPDDIRISPYRGAVADWSDDDEPLPLPECDGDPWELDGDEPEDGDELPECCAPLEPEDGDEPEALPEYDEEPERGESRFRLLNANDLSSLPPVRWLVRGVLPAEGIGAVFGASRAGKSFLVLDLLANIACGRDWFCFRTKTAVPVVYLGLEGEAGVAQRVLAWQVHNGPLPQGFRAILQPIDIRSRKDRAELVQAIKEAGLSGGVLVLDTLNRAAPGADENSAADMGQIIAALKWLQAALGGLVLAVHHVGKDVARGMRGHSSLLAALDAAIEVVRDGDRREWKVDKSKDGEDGTAHPFELSVIEVGTDDEGQPITSCVCRPAAPTGETVRRAKVPAGGNQRIVWDALGELLRDAGNRSGGRSGSAPDCVPPGRPAIPLDLAISGVRDRLTVPDERKTERTRQAVTALINRGLLVCRDGWIWCA